VKHLKSEGRSCMENNAEVSSTQSIEAEDSKPFSAQ
jgi:hypothetical protein